MSSVKGLTWGTPEFVEIAKRGEIEGEIVAVIEETRRGQWRAKELSEFWEDEECTD